MGDIFGNGGFMARLRIAHLNHLRLSSRCTSSALAFWLVTLSTVSPLLSPTNAQKNTPVALELAEQVNPANTEAGQKVKFSVKEAVVYDDKLLIEKSTIAVGTTESASKAPRTDTTSAELTQSRPRATGSRPQSDRDQRDSELELNQFVAPQKEYPSGYFMARALALPMGASGFSVVTFKETISNAPGMGEYRWWNQDFCWTHNFNDPFFNIVSATLTIEAWDVDSDAAVDPEVDVISVNGIPVGTLVGSTNVWTSTTFNLDPSLVGQRTLRVCIDIDSTHTSDHWAVTIGSSELLVAYELKPGVPPPSTNFGRTGNPSGTSSDPVNTATGNYTFQHTDIAIPGRGIPFVFLRTYNSQDTYFGPLGFGWTHSYNLTLREESPFLVAIKWGDGHEDFYIDEEGDGTFAGLFGSFDTLSRSGGGYILTKKDQSKYHFDPAGRLLGIEDRNGNRISLEYDFRSGKLTTITDTVGRTFSLSYDNRGRLVKITDPIGRTIEYGYDMQGRLVTVKDARGGVTKYVYNQHNLLIEITDPRGSKLVKNEYDLQRRVIAQTNARGFKTTFTYGKPGIWDTTITDPLGNKTIHTHDDRFRLIKETDPLGKAITYEYDEKNNRTKITDKNGNVTRFRYDERGNLIGIIDPLGNSTVFAYDTNNNLLSAQNPRGNITRFTYDAKGNLVAITDPAGNVTRFAYDAFGQLISKTDARGNTTTYTYDSSGNLTRITDALGNSTNLSYDGIGRLVSITDANGHTVSAIYDLLSRVVKITDPLNNQTQFEYDEVGNLLKIIDANGNVTTYAYDGTNNLVSVTDAIGNVTKYTYDGNNNRVTFTDAKGNTTSYAYDALNRLIRITDPLSLVTSYTYDAVGNVIAITDAKGQTTRFTYDALNRLTAIAYADGKNVQYSYDANGNRTTMVDTHGTTTYTYDALNRLISVTHPGGKMVRYAYDAVGNRSSLTYPDGKVVNYTYDEVNRLKSVTDWLGRTTSYHYDAVGNLIGIIYPNQAAISFVYDAGNRLVQVRNTFQGSDTVDPTPVTSFTYSLDPVGNRLQVTDGSGKVTSYAYDRLYQLTSVTVGSQVTHFTYDAVGNRLSMIAPGTSVSYSYDAGDRLLTAGTTTFTYDPNGNQITKTSGGTTVTYSYDAANRLVSVTGGGTTNTFGYDGDGNRISQSVGSGATNYINDVATVLPVVLQESGPDGDTTYVYGLGLISASNPAFEFFYHYDGLGSVVGLTDPMGRLKGRYEYDAWGQTILATPGITATNKFRFTGEALDPGTGLYYLRARYYDPSTGRFLSRDSFPGFDSIPQSLHPYQYALNNPVLYTDPSGKVVPIVAVLAIGAVTGGVFGGISYWATAGDNFTFGGLVKAIGIGAAAGTVGAGAGLGAGLLVGAVGISGATGAVLSGAVSEATSQIVTNLLTGQPLDEHLAISAVLGGLLSGVARVLPGLSFIGPGPSYTWQLNPRYFGPNSWRALGQKFFSSTAGGTLKLGFRVLTTAPQK